MEITNNKTFCIMPWVHLHGWPNGNAYLCCIANNGGPDAAVGDLSKNSIAEIMNNDKMKQIRLDMLAGKEIPACSNCYKMENYKVGAQSWRVSNNKQFEDITPALLDQTKEDGTIVPKQLYVDFRFSNLCNLSCRSCTSDLSSSIAATPGRGFGQKNIQLYKDRNVWNNNTVSFTNARGDFIKDDLLQYLEETRCFYFAGGESLIQKEHFEILSHLDEKKWYDKEIRYNTNLSNLKYKGTDLVEMWKRFDNVWIMCSIDQVGDKLEYLREGINSKRLFENLNTLVTNKFKISITHVVSIYNVYYLYDFIKFLDDNNYLESIHAIDALYAFGDSLSPALLPQWAKDELISKLRKDAESDLYKKLFKLFPFIKVAFTSGLENYINDNIQSYTFDKFIQTTEELDKVYNKDMYKTFPWLGEVVDNYKNIIR